ncbi:MAG: hypothetical protein ABSD48_01030 [Armatimonadota bacterium]|jgi:hypothetical protein
MAEDSSAVTRLEHDLDSFDIGARAAAVAKLDRMVEQGRAVLPQAGERSNLHCHTFFSYNPYGYSPSKLAWLTRKAGLAVTGIVDFDVLDGLDEFVQTGARLGLKTCVGMETRVYIPEFSDKVMNSPGEPGVSYHMGVGFPTADLDASQQRFLSGLRKTSEERNRKLVERVNAFLAPTVLHYDGDVLPLTPAGNATERHICLAYALKARAVFGDDQQLIEYWGDRLGTDASALESLTGFQLQGLIRSKTMKKGGVGYVQPDSGSFPWLAATNEFIVSAGAIPTHTWLDGTSDGEALIEDLLRVVMRSGVAAINVIPDRNYTPGRPDVKLQNLYHVVEVARGMGLLVVAGTEMNSPGHKLVDDFCSPELVPLVPAFLTAAYAVYAHSVMQKECGLGYMSEWARQEFPELAARSEFYEAVGRALRVGKEHALAGFTDDASPHTIMERLK